MAQEKLLIPHYMMGQDIWVTEPKYYRKDGAKFCMNDDLSQKDRQHLVECGIALVVEGGAIAVAKKEKEQAKAEAKAQETETQEK